MKVLQSIRLLLEPLVPNHANELFACISDVRLYEFIAEESPSSQASLRARYERLSLRQSDDGNELWLNWALKTIESPRYIGYVQASVRRDGTADIAYMIFFTEWGNGYAREAVSAMLSHLATEYGVKIAIARVDTRNTRSITLLKTLGFQQTVIRRDAEWIKGVLTDEAEYRLPLSS